MSAFFESYEDARRFAQDRANVSRLSYGIERVSNALEKGYVVRGLPKPENRSGWELRCEVVDPI
jgi:hypothetical protein